MSMYEMICGTNQFAPMCIHLIGLDITNFGRYRDAYLTKENGEWVVGIFARVGGGNREMYDYVFKKLKENEDFIRDFDDPEDPTYCHFLFKVSIPNKELKTINANEQRFLDSNPTIKMKKALEELGKEKPHKTSTDSFKKFQI